MNKDGTTYWRRWLSILATLVLCIGLGTTQASAAAPYVPIYTTNNNFTMLDTGGATVGGTNDVTFTWDGTLKTSVVASGQVSNATIVTPCTSISGTTLTAHDVAVYGPGTYTVKASCAPKAPGCATGTNPITFTVGPDEIGVHMLVDWGKLTANKNIDVVNVWKKGSAFTPSTMFTGACGSNSAGTVWSLMSRDDGTGKNGYPMVDGGFIGQRFNFNMMGAPINRSVDTANNNFTMDQPDSIAFGGTNDIRFTWDGTMKTSVATSGQVSNATLSSSCAFFGQPWWAHDMVIYGPGTYTVYTACAAGSPGCGNDSTGHYTFTVKAGELGVHTLFFWNGNDNIDVVDVWRQGSFDQGVDPTVCTPAEFWAGACLTGDPAKVWDHMSYDWDNDCVNGSGMVDGPFTGMNANFNTMGNPPQGCVPANCNDNNACTTDACVGTTCTHTPIVCNDNSACTTDTCNSATGCVFTPISCNDNNACTSDSCSTSTGCVHATITCNDNNACTTDTCNTATGCVFTTISCNDNNACTTDTCNTATGCIHAAVVCNDNNSCTTDTCNTATGCVFTPIVCNDNLACTTDSCNTATGCVFTNTCPSGQSCTPSGCSSAPCTSNAMCNDNNACTTDICNTATGVCSNTTINCNDNNACTTDTCNTATGCVFTPISCNDNNACTTDTCNTATGCVHTAVVCNDNNLCTTDTCNTATGCVFTPVTCPAGQTCNPATGTCVAPNLCTDKVCNDTNACTTDTCDPVTGNCVFTPIVCNDNNACTTDTCNTATGCVYTPIPGCGVTGSDVGIVSFRVPSHIKDCRNAVPIQIKIRNFGNTKVTGSLTLYKDGVPVKTWMNLVFHRMSNVNKIYLYHPAGDSGETISWQAVVTVPNDPNLSNNTSSIKTTVVSKCKDKGKKDKNRGRDRDGDRDNDRDRDRNGQN